MITDAIAAAESGPTHNRLDMSCLTYGRPQSLKMGFGLSTFMFFQKAHTQMEKKEEIEEENDEQ